MGLLSIDALKEGMVLDADVVQNGQIIVRAGTELTKRLLTICRSWGIISVAIKGVDPAQVEQDFFASLPPEILERAEAKARENTRFFNTSHPLDQILYQIHLRRLIEQRAA
jgi:hypothetical protein